MVLVVELLSRQMVAAVAVAQPKLAKTRLQEQVALVAQAHRSTRLLAAHPCLRAVAAAAVDKLLAARVVQVLVVQVARQAELRQLQTRQAVAVAVKEQAAQALTVVQESFTFDGRFRHGTLCTNG